MILKPQLIIKYNGRWLTCKHSDLLPLNRNELHRYGFYAKETAPDKNDQESEFQSNDPRSVTEMDCYQGPSIQETPVDTSSQQEDTLTTPDQNESKLRL